MIEGRGTVVDAEGFRWQEPGLPLSRGNFTRTLIATCALASPRRTASRPIGSLSPTPHTPRDLPQHRVVEAWRHTAKPSRAATNLGRKRPSPAFREAMKDGLAQ